MWEIFLSIVQRLACDLIIYSLIKAFAGRWGHRVHIDWQRPLSALSGVHSIMMEKLARAGEGGGCTPSPLRSIYHHVQSFRYIPPISSLPLFLLCGWGCQ
jgi:hypothetical protein